MFRQSINASSSSAVASLQTSPINTKAGSLMAVGFVSFGTVSNAVLTDNFGNTWIPHPLNPESIASHNTQAWAWYCPNIQAGNGHTFTVTTTGSGNCSMVAQEFINLDLFNPLVATGGATETLVVASHTLGTITTPQDGCDIFAFCFDDSSVDEAFNPGAGGWLIPNFARNTQGSLYRPSLGEFIPAALTGTYTIGFVSNQTSQGGSLAFAFKQPSYTFIQQASVSVNAASGSVTAGVSPQPTFTAGNLLLYVAKYTFANKIPVVVADLLGNTFVEASNFYDLSGNNGFSWGFSTNIMGGADNVTASFGGNTPTFAALYVAEFSGLDKIAPYTTGESVITKVVSPGTGTDAIASSLTPGLGKQPSLLFGFTFDSTDTIGQVISGGTGFNDLPGVWLFGTGSTFAGNPEHRRLAAFDPVRTTASGSVGTDTYFQLAFVLAEANAQQQLSAIVSSGVFVCP